MTNAATVSATAGGASTPVRLRSLALFALFTLAMFPIHELAHYLTYRAFGVQVRMTLNTASPADPSLGVPIAELAGPIVNLPIAGAAAVFLRAPQRRRWLAELVLAAALMRLVVYVIVVVAALITGSGLSMGNDEPIAASLSGLPSLTFVAIFAVPFGYVVARILRSFGGTGLTKAAHLLTRGLLTLAIGLFVGSVLDPWLFSGPVKPGLRPARHLPHGELSHSRRAPSVRTTSGAVPGIHAQEVR